MIAGRMDRPWICTRAPNLLSVWYVKQKVTQTQKKSECFLKLLFYDNWFESSLELRLRTLLTLRTHFTETTAETTLKESLP